MGFGLDFWCRVWYFYGMASKRKNNTGKTEERMWRVNQRAHKFTDRKKKASREACRNRKGW